MDLLWSPWRYDYITSEVSGNADDNEACVFCRILTDPAPDDEKFILHRAGSCFVILNIYPYITGHLMVIPFDHVSDLDALEKVVSDELTDLTKRCQTVLRETYGPDGFNVGINIGKAAGAGVAGHLHQHILPRWIGDSNFMTAVGQTRTIPEALSVTYSKLKPKF